MLTDNVFYNNWRAYHGQARHTMLDNQFIDNGPYGGVFIEGNNYSNHEISRNEIMYNDNTSSNEGWYTAGLWLYLVNDASIEDNVIVGNIKNTNKKIRIVKLT